MVCVNSKKSRLHRRISCCTLHAHGLTAFLFLWTTALHLCSTLQTGVSPAIRNQDSCLTVSPNRARSHVASPTLLSRLAVRRLRLCSYPQEKHALVRLTTLSIVATPAVSEMDERQNLGMLTSSLLTQERDKGSTIQDLSFSKKNILSLVHHPFLPVR